MTAKSQDPSVDELHIVMVQHLTVACFGFMTNSVDRHMALFSVGDCKLYCGLCESIYDFSVIV